MKIVTLGTKNETQVIDLSDMSNTSIIKSRVMYRVTLCRSSHSKPLPAEPQRLVPWPGRSPLAGL